MHVERSVLGDCFVVYYIIYIVSDMCAPRISLWGLENVAQIIQYGYGV